MLQFTELGKFEPSQIEHNMSHYLPIHGISLDWFFYQNVFKMVTHITASEAKVVALGTLKVSSATNFISRYFFVS